MWQKSIWEKIREDQYVGNSDGIVQLGFFLGFCFFICKNLIEMHSLPLGLMSRELSLADTGFICIWRVGREAKGPQRTMWLGMLLVLFCSHLNDSSGSHVPKTVMGPNEGSYAQDLNGSSVVLFQDLQRCFSALVFPLSLALGAAPLLTGSLG